MKRILMAVCLLIPAAGFAEIRSESVSYREGKTELEGVVVYDDALSAARPGVLVAPAWKGITDFERGQAKKVAELGYVAFIVDMYGKNSRPNDDQEAAKMSGALKANRTLLRARMKAALDQLRGRQNVDKSRIAAIGFCFGGTSVLELARAGEDVAAAVSFHGNLSTPSPEDAKNIKGSVLVLHGADDPYVPQEEVDGFVKEMKAGEVKDWQLVQYSNAVHSFTHPHVGTDNSKGAAYNETAARRSWRAMTALFEEKLKR